MHSHLIVFLCHIQEIERENNSVVEVLKSLTSMCSTLHGRKTHNFMSLKVKELLAQKRKDGLDKACDRFCAEVAFLYNTCLKYLEKWMRPLEDFSSFMWISLNRTPDWNEIESCVNT